MENGNLTVETFKKEWSKFAILFDKTISKEKLDILWEAFTNKKECWSEASFLRASKAVMEQCRFMPTVADFYERRTRD